MTHIHSANVHDFVAKKPRVFLDGTEMDCGVVTEANEEGGYIVIGIVGKDRSIFVDPRTDEVRTVRLLGRVDITFNSADLSPQQYSEIAQLFHRKNFKVA